MRLKRTGKLALAAPGATALKRSSSELEAEVNRLRRELANAKLDLEIVKKAAAYFAKESR
jgi:transposase